MRNIWQCLGLLCAFNASARQSDSQESYIPRGSYEFPSLDLQMDSPSMTISCRGDQNCTMEIDRLHKFSKLRQVEPYQAQSLNPQQVAPLQEALDYASSHTGERGFYAVDEEMLARYLRPVLASHPRITRCWDLDVRTNYFVMCMFDKPESKRDQLYFFGKTQAPCAGFCKYIIATMERTPFAEASAKPNPPGPPFVRVQTCLPTKRVVLEDFRMDSIENVLGQTGFSQQQLDSAPRTIRRFVPDSEPEGVASGSLSFQEALDTNGVLSLGGSPLTIVASTVKGQPVYEQSNGNPSTTILAMNVGLPAARTKKELIKYWFTLPSVVREGMFSDWFEPVSMEREPVLSSVDNGSRLMHSKPLVIYPVSQNPPKMRVMLQPGSLNPSYPGQQGAAWVSMSIATLRCLAKHGRTNADRSPCTFLPKTTERIPSCD